MASVKVAIRVRPFNQRERDMNADLIVKVDGKKTRILNQKVAQGKDGDLGRERYKDFTFDYSYWSFDDAGKNFASQEMVFEDLGTDVIDSAYEGYNACVFAYGQTGSGKTFTMMGTPENQGLIPRICQTLFDRMAAGKAAGASYRTEVSYLEIYNERVKDLLTPGDQHSLRVREHPRLGPYVQDLSYHLVTDYEHIQELMHRGNMQRTTASTNMNNTSSRSHAIFTLTFAQAGFNNEMMPSETVSKVHLVDLAGSERADTSGATGQRLKEGAHINKSLVTLGSVISALAELSSNAGPRRMSVFIPYRDSVLTWLLKDSLGGNSKTIMIAAISPADCNYGETLSTLRYANRAKNIINKPTINEDPNVKLIRDLREEISKLKALLGNEFTVESHVLERELHQMEQQEKVLTEEWAEKWRETQQILHEQKALGLRKAGLGVVLDSDMPHLVGIDDDLLSTGVTLYHLRDGETLIGTEEADAPQDIMLNGNGVEPEHCCVVLANGVATLIPRPHAQCWVNTVAVDKPTKLSQGCIILLGRTNMFRYNDPVEAAKMRKEGSRSHLNLSRLSLLSFSTPDLAWSTENLSALIVSEDPEQVEELEMQKAMLLKDREAFRREQAERERDWEREQREKKDVLERAQRELDTERQRLEREYAAQCRQLAQDWRRLEQRQLESLETMREREAELNQRREMLEVEKGSEEDKVASEYSKVAELTAKLETKKEEFGVFMSKVLSHLEHPDAVGGSELSRRVVKSLQLLAAEKLTPEKPTSPHSESSSESFASFSQEPENIKNVLNSHKRELADLEAEIRERVSSLHERQENISKMESELGVITSSLEVGSSELKAMREALAKRSDQQLMEISQKKQSLSLDLRRTTSVQRALSEDGDSSDVLLSPAPTDTFSSSLGTGETFHTAGSAAAEGRCLENSLKLVNGSAVNGTGGQSSPEASNGATADSESEMSSTEDCRKRLAVSGNSENSTSSFEKVSPLTEIQNGTRIRRPRIQNSKYCRAVRQNGAQTAHSSRSVNQLMRSMKRLCQLVTQQKMLIMQSLENDCDKAELDAQIAVLQDLQRQYVRLEVTLDQHPLRPITLDNVGSSEESDNQSTSADDGMSDLMAESKSPKLDNDFRDMGGGGDGPMSPFGGTQYSEVSSRDEDARGSPSCFQANLLTITNFFLRGVGSSTHYEYEVSIFCATGERWTVLRRFKRFRELHLTMRLRYGAPVDILSFPRRTFFSKNTESIARRRRVQLEQYLRALVETCSRIPSCPLHDCSAGVTRMALLEFSAFFRKGVFESGKYGTS